MKNNTISILFTFFLFMSMLFSCTGDNSDYRGDYGSSGTGGSVARFTIKGDYLYTVDNQTLKSS